MMRKFVPLFLISTLLLFSIQFIGCASSKPKKTETKEASKEDDLGEIERLLGISPQDKEQKQQPEQQPKQQQKKNDDLITLLKADEDKGTSKTEAKGTSDTGIDPRLTNLQNQVGDLQDQLTDKNRTIADLKAQIMQKDEELKKYKSGQVQPTPTKPTYQDYTPNVSGSQSYGERNDYENTYDQALDLFHSAQYRDAMSMFESLLSQNRNHSLSDNAQYWIGECNYALGNYRAAILAFEKVFTFTQSNKNDYAQYMLGQCYYKLGDHDRAREEFQNLIDNYTNPELIEMAHSRLQQLQ